MSKTTHISSKPADRSNFVTKMTRLFLYWSLFSACSLFQLLYLGQMLTAAILWWEFLETPALLGGHSLHQEIRHQSDIRRTDLRTTLPSCAFPWSCSPFPILAELSTVPTHAPPYTEPRSYHFLRKFVNKEIITGYQSSLETRNKGNCCWLQEEKGCFA